MDQIPQQINNLFIYNNQFTGVGDYQLVVYITNKIQLLYNFFFSSHQSIKAI